MHAFRQVKRFSFNRFLYTGCRAPHGQNRLTAFLSRASQAFRTLHLPIRAARPQCPAKSTKNSGGPCRRHSAYGLASAPPCSPHTSRVRKALYPPIRAALLSHLLTTVVSGVTAKTSCCIAPTAYSKILWPYERLTLANINSATKKKELMSPSKMPIKFNPLGNKIPWPPKMPLKMPL